MTTITTRAVKGSPLTHNEVDANFTNLNTDKLDTAGIALGTAASPTIKFTGDTNTGIYSPGADQVAISTGGTLSLGIAPAGGLLVGKTTGDAAIEVGSGATANRFAYIDFIGDTTHTDYGLRVMRGNTGPNAASLITNKGTGGIYITQEGAGPVSIATSNTERLRITSAGNVGIGTSAPTEVLELSRANGGGDVVARFVHVGQVEYKVGISDADDKFYITNNNGNAAVGSNTKGIILLADGKVGIGTSAPSQLLHVNGGMQVGALDASPAYIEVGNGATGNRTAYIDFVGDTTYADYGLRLIRNSTGANTASAIDHRGTGDFQLVAREAAPITFATNNTERARIDSAGRLLVGTSSNIAGAYAGTSRLQSISDSNALWYAAGFFGYHNDTNPTVLQIGHSRSTSPGHTILLNGDAFGTIRFEGSDGAKFLEGASITAGVDGTPGLNDMPGRIILSTTADGASVPTEHWRLTNGGVVVYNQPAPAAVDATATLTVANLTSRIITSTTAAAVTMTLPTGTLMDGGFSGLYTNMAFEWSVINTGATNAVTVQAGSGHTLVGSGTVAANNSQRFLSRRTAANTWVTYRLT